MKTISVDGTINVDDLLQALGLFEIPAGCELSMNDEVEVAVIADEDALRDELEPDPEGLETTFNRGDVMGLAAAIRRGDTTEAELLLDRLIADATGGDVVAEWVQQGRY